MENLSPLQIAEKPFGGIRDMVGSTVRHPATRVFHHVIFAGLLIGLNCSAQPVPLKDRGHVNKQLEVATISPLGTYADAAQFAPQLGPGWISESVKLSTSGQHESVTKREAGADNGAQQKHEYRPENRASANDMTKGISHYNLFLMLALNFFGGLFSSLVIAFVMRAKKYGINTAWRDLVFDWPIPYWMRFVPKEEQDL